MLCVVGAFKSLSVREFENPSIILNDVPLPRRGVRVLPFAVTPEDVLLVQDSENLDFDLSSFACDRPVVAVSNFISQIHFYDVLSGNQIRTSSVPSGWGLGCVARVGPSPMRLVSGQSKREIVTFNAIESLNCCRYRCLSTHPRALCRILPHPFSPGRVLLSGGTSWRSLSDDPSLEGGVHEFDLLESNSQISTNYFRGHFGRVWGLGVVNSSSPTSSILCTSASDASLYLWNLQASLSRRRPFAQLDLPGASRCLCTVDEEDGSSHSPVVIVGAGESVQAFDVRNVRTLRPIWTLRLAGCGCVNAICGGTGDQQNEFVCGCKSGDLVRFDGVTGRRKGRDTPDSRIRFGGQISSLCYTHFNSTERETSSKCNPCVEEGWEEEKQRTSGSNTGADENTCDRSLRMSILANFLFLALAGVICAICRRFC